MQTGGNGLRFVVGDLRRGVVEEVRRAGVKVDQVDDAAEEEAEEGEVVGGQVLGRREGPTVVKLRYDGLRGELGEVQPVLRR